MLVCGFIWKLFKNDTFFHDQPVRLVCDGFTFISFFCDLSFRLFSSSVFYIYITASLLSLFFFPFKLSAFLSSMLSSSFHLSFTVPPFLPSSAFVPAVLAYSAGSAPAAPIILTEEKEKEQKKGMGEEWKP